MAMLEVHYDSSRIPPGDQLRCWREAAATLFYPAERQPVPPARGFPGRLASRQCASMRILHVSYPAMTSERQPERTGSSERVYMALMRSGAATMRSGQHTMRQEQGDVAIWDGDEHDQWTFHQPIDAFCVSMPKTALRTGLELHGRGLVLGKDSWMCDGIASLIHAAATMEAPSHGSAAFRVQEALINAALAGWEARDRRDARIPRGSRLALAQEYIDARLADPELQAGDVAAAVHVSDRTLNRLFAALHTTPAAWIWSRRLEMAHRLLLEPGGRSVTEVALACGFKSLSHFSHAFKNAYGLAPARLARASGDRH